MSNKSIMKTASFMTRRKVIIYILVTILVLGIVAGFTDPFITDNTVHTAGFGETIVMEAEPPAEGKPEDYDLISNLKFAAYKLHHASFFRGETNGKTEADLGITTYTQNVFNKRVATGNGVVFAETISSSSMKSVAEQKYADNGIIIFRPSTSINGNSATFANTAYQMSYDDYSQKYGTVPNQLSKYIINEKTIIGVKDENAPAQAAANSSKTKPAAKTDGNDSEDRSGFDFYVPENLVRGADGNYKFTLTLDPEASTLYYRNEVRTLGGADQNPKFYSAALTVTIDENWNPVSVRTVENYDIAIPVMGAMNCTGTLTEVFSQIGDTEGVVPEREFFQPYVDSALDDPNYVPPGIPETPASPADYLAAAFADYLSGEKNLELNIDLSAGDITAYDLTVSIDLGTTAVQMMLGDLYVKYAGDTVNIKLNDINGYLSVNDFNELMQNDGISALVGSLGNFDIMSLFGGDMLGTVFANCEMTSTNGVTRIRMPFDLDVSALLPEIGAISVDASIYINDEDKSLLSITGDIEIADFTVSVEAEPLSQSPIFPSTDGATDLSDILDFIPDIITLAESQTFEISGSITAMGQTFDVNAYIDVRDGLKVDGTVTALGVEISVKYADGTFYIGLGNIDIRGTADELPALTEMLLGNAQLNNYLNMIKMMLPATVNDFTGIIRSLDVTDNRLTLGLNFLTAPVTVSLERADNAISGIGFSVDFDLFGISFDAAADLDISVPEARDISLPTGTEYITVTQLAELAETILPYIDAEGYTINVNCSAITDRNSYSLTADIGLTRDLDMIGSIDGLGISTDIVFKDGVLYAAVGNNKYKFDKADIDALKTPALRLVDLFAEISSAIPVSPRLPDLLRSAISSVRSLTVTDNTLNAVVSICGNDIYVSLDALSGTLNIVGDIAGVRLDVTAVISIPQNAVTVAPPADADNYFDVARLGATIDKIADAAETKAFRTTATVAVGNTTFNFDIKASFTDGLKINITEPTLPLDMTVIGDTAYISVFDGIRVSGSLGDIPTALEVFNDIIPQDIRDAINGALAMLDATPDITQLISIAIGSIENVSVGNDGIALTVAYGGITAQFNCTLTLDEIMLAVRTEKLSLTLSLSDIAFEQPVFPQVNAEDYAPLSSVITALSAVLPLASEEAFEISLSGKLFDTYFTGNIYIGFTDGLQVDAKLTLGDLPIGIAVKNGYVYLSVGSTVKVYEQLSETALYSVADELENIMPGIKEKLTSIIERIKSMTVKKLLDIISLTSCENGFEVGFDLSQVGFDGNAKLDFIISGGALRKIAVEFAASGQTISLDLDAELAEGKLVSLDCVEADIAGITLSLGIGIRGTTARNVTIGSGYIAATDILRLISPLAEIAKDANDVRSITLGLNAFVLTSGNKQTSVTGSVSLSLAPLAAQIDLVLFAGTSDEVFINIVYAQDTAYIKIGNVKLSLNTQTDIKRLYDILEKFMPGYTPDDPGYINDELAKLLGLKPGASAFSDVSLLIERLKQISATTDARALFGLLFSGINGLSGDSTVKTLIDMIGIFKRDGEIGVSATVMGITLNVIPHICEFDGKNILASVSADATLFGQYLRIDVTDLDLSSQAYDILPPADADTYVSVVEFVETIDNAVSTFTAKNEQGDITFELNELNFDYETYEIETTTDEFGNTVNVKDEAGRDKPRTDEAGNKIKSDTIKVYNKPGYPALKGLFKKVDILDEQGEIIDSEFKFNLEAHIVLDIRSFTYTSPITLDLYVINDEDNDGVVILDYMEGNGNGERLFIDYTSVMQILAAAMDIINVDEELMEELLGDYRLNVDTSVFDSMNIAGLDAVKVMVDKIADAVRSARSALNDIKSAWNEIATAGSIDGLRERLDGIKALAGSAIAKFKSAIALFKPADDGADSEQPSDPVGPSDPMRPVEINGKLISDIVNGISFEKTDTQIKATVDNDLITGTAGVAVIAVTQNNGKIDSIEVGSLDVNTAKLNDFTARFAAGREVTVTAPQDYATALPSGMTYSNFSNLKHLLFDVMNTANMLEFDIGGLNTSDAISINMKLGADWLANLKLNVKYNAKVKIIKVGEDEAGKPIYKTAAAVEIHNEKAQLEILGIGSKVIVPDCTTRLFFFDDVLYLQGVRSWQNSTQNRVVGTITDITCIAKRWGKEETRKPTIVNTRYSAQTTDNMDYVDVMYTIDELFWMMNNDIGKFLDEFLFYLIPITTEKIAGQDIRGLIKNNIGGSSSGSKDESSKTIAQVFKGYTYNGGKHSLTIGLAELASSSSLGDLNVSLIGANDGDDNYLDNYISSLNVNTSIAGIINVDLTATLRNVAVADDRNSIHSKGLAPTNITQAQGKYAANGINYLFDCFNYDRNTLYTLDGLTYYTADGNDLYVENGSFAPVLRPTDDNDQISWTSTAYDKNYCENACIFGDTYATYYYYASLKGYGYRCDGNDVYYIGVAADGSKYVYRVENGNRINIAVKSITNDFLAEVERDDDGKITAIRNRTGGVNWTRPWKEAYDSANAAA